MEVAAIPENETKRLEVLHSLKILDTDAEERFDRITRIARKLFNVPIAIINFIDAQRLWIKSCDGMECYEVPRAQTFCSHVILNDDIMVVKDATKDKRFHDNPFVENDPQIRFYVGCPLKVKNFNVGTLCMVDKKPRQFSEAELAMTQDLANLIQLELETVHQSTTDELTGLSNRRGFIAIGSEVFKLSKRNKNKLALLFFDLDKFKMINDNFGHAEGDKVLQCFSALLRKHFRESDVVARLGGDEFCVLCSGVGEEELSIILERFNEALHSQQIVPYEIEDSVGTILYDPNHHESIEAMLEEADALMYKNKNRKEKV